MTFGKTLTKKRFWNKSLSVNLFLLIFGFVKVGYSQSYSRPSITPIFLNYKTNHRQKLGENGFAFLNKNFSSVNSFKLINYS